MWIVLLVGETIAAKCLENPTDKVISQTLLQDNMSICTFVVRRCVFQDLTDSGIVILQTESITRIFDTTFNNCWNTEIRRIDKTGWAPPKGGGCHLWCSEGTLERICAYNCVASCVGQFLVIHCVHTSLTDISIFKCGVNSSLIPSCQDVMHVLEGNQEIHEINSSTNFVLKDGAAFESTDSVVLRLSYCSFTHSSGASIMSLLLRDKSLAGDHTMATVNLYNNTVIGTSLGLFNLLGNITITNWIFLKNTVVSIAKETWFSPAGGGYEPVAWEQNMTIENCISDLPMTGVSFHTINHKIVGSDAKTHTMFHWQTYLCPGRPTYEFTQWEKGLQCGKWGRITIMTEFLLYLIV